ncbi:MAG: hypothetical protein CBB68_15190 [Rhodospirillaceae bacterium TMED8]|nr:ADP-heptose--LPS heptosyltransferase [Magnetovibrio sp.]OUT47771.1 MAG: hypothetical protein CBB68_15190 [Rhodospirillaceae bacterium TMED8]
MPGPILIIKFGALGDFIQALGPMAAIRAHHQGRIVLLTTRPFIEFAEKSGYINDVWLDTRPQFWEWNAWSALRRALRKTHFERIYDLQTSYRSSFYHRLFFPDKPPQWSGIAKGCSNPHNNPNRDFMHTIERQAEQLRAAGVPIEPFNATHKLNLDWANVDVSHYGLTSPFVIIVPGGAPHRPEKRWPVDRYITVAKELIARGKTPVIIGKDSEKQFAEKITEQAKDSLNLTGQTSLLEIAGLARKATGAVGNDTGPMHLISAVGCRSVVLFSQGSNPELCAQRGEDVTILYRASLTAISPAHVIDALRI